MLRRLKIKKQYKKLKRKPGLFSKICKKSLQHLAKGQVTSRPRALQVYILMLTWSDINKTRCVAHEYHYGRSKGKVCWSAKLKEFIKNKTKLRHKQVVRYLNEFESNGMIYTDDKQKWLDGRIKPQKFIKENVWLKPKQGDPFLILKLKPGFGLKGFDIYDYIEKAYNADKHPKHDQLRFNINNKTRWYRARPTKVYVKKKARKRSKSGEQSQPTSKSATIPKMTPIKILNPLKFYSSNKIKDKTAKAEKKFENEGKYSGKFRLRPSPNFHGNDFWVDWWKVKREDATAGPVAPIEKACWYRGKLYRQSSFDPYLFIYSPKFKTPYKEDKREQLAQSPRFCADLEGLTHIFSSKDQNLKQPKRRIIMQNKITSSEIKRRKELLKNAFPDTTKQNTFDSHRGIKSYGRAKREELEQKLKVWAENRKKSPSPL